jgi:hypothetical protein
MATAAANQSNGFEWRILLGPTHAWQIPSMEFGTTADPASAIECCELCGESVGDGRSFTTNSAGQHPIHLACSGSDEPLAAIGLRPPRITWLRFLQSFAGG